VSSPYDGGVTSDVDIARIATVIGDRTRAAMLSALHEGAPLPGGELARRAGVTAPTASEHLARLVDARLVSVERRGRHRFYTLAGEEVARAWEALSLIAPQQEVTSLRAASVGAALVEARTCYDHLAGRLGVAVTDRLLATGTLEERDGGFLLGDTGELLPALGIDVADLRGRRPLVLRCLDWSERRPHVAGALGAAIASKCLEQRWIDRLPGTRAVRITEAGREAFAATLGLRLAPR
jgi:DNA-binding transcriptional ArsR family regulator